MEGEIEATTVGNDADKRSSVKLDAVPRPREAEYTAWPSVGEGGREWEGGEDDVWSRMS